MSVRQGRSVTPGFPFLFPKNTYGLLAVVAASFAAVRWTKSSYAHLTDGPKVLSIYPEAVVPGAVQRISVVSDRTNFGPETTIRPEVPGVTVWNYRFASDHELTFEVFLREGRDREERAGVPITIRSPKDGAGVEDVKVLLLSSKEAEPISLDLFSFEGKDAVITDKDFVLFGYEAGGYAPFRFSVKDKANGKVFRQETRSRVEHLGVPMEPGPNVFEATLSDALGREVKKEVLVRCDAEPPPSFLAGLGLLSYCYASIPYSSRPVLWGGYSVPSDQIPASDCVLGNGPLGCASGCGGGGVGQVPIDYVTTLGETAVGGDGVLLHNGQFREDVVDLVIPGKGLDFVWKRSYQSGINLDGQLGPNWDFSWGAHSMALTKR